MESLIALWLPILVSSVIVFVASAITHMVLPYHRRDYGPVPTEDQVMNDLRRASIPAGDYAIPFCSSPKEMSSPEFVEKMRRGPMAFLTVLPGGSPPNMGRLLGLWFVYILIVNALAAYVGHQSIGPSTDYGHVFQITGATALAAYALYSWPQSIWYYLSWSTTLKNTIDGIIYALLVGGTFGWLWPAV